MSCYLYSDKQKIIYLATPNHRLDVYVSLMDELLRNRLRDRLIDRLIRLEATYPAFITCKDEASF